MHQLHPVLLPELRQVIGSVSSHQTGLLDEFSSIYGPPRLRVAIVGGEGSEYKRCPVCNSVTDQKLTEPECFPIADLDSDIFFDASGGSLYIRDPAIEACDLRSVPNLQIIEVAACGEEPPPWGADWWNSIPD